MEEPTHRHGNILDLVLTNIPEYLQDIKVVKTNSPIASDHCPTYFSLKTGVQSFIKEKCREVYNYSKMDIQGVYDYLFDLDFSFCYNMQDVELDGRR